MGGKVCRGRFSLRQLTFLTKVFDCSAGNLADAVEVFLDFDRQLISYGFMFGLVRSARITTPLGIARTDNPRPVALQQLAHFDGASF
jgi:hypothetical protein